MNDSLFYNNIKENEKNQHIIQEIKQYVHDMSMEQVYLITAPLGEKKYTYTYEENVIVILSPKHQIIFLDLSNDKKKFDEYYDEFIEDLGFISDKFNYKKHLGRPKVWQDELTVQDVVTSNFSIKNLFMKYEIDKNLQRKNELLISLLVGSINNLDKIGVDEPESTLEKIKNKIVLFDGEQTKFIYKQIDKKSIYIQGLSGTGKTELLLHKLKDIYTSSDDSKIFFTCHSKTLANTLKKRVPEFFDFMQVGKQIGWNERLWLDRAWGSMRDKNSGLYSYICDFYNLQFKKFSYSTNYENIFTSALEEINKIDNSEFKHAFDYILIDERQDFPDIFFELCEKITVNKVYIAGDIFQKIYEGDFEKRVVDVDFILNKCYRTDPKTLMFAHAIGMGLFEAKKLNWLTDKEWEASGYKIEKDNRNVSLSRESIRRFEDLEDIDSPSMNIKKLESISQVISIIVDIKKKYSTLKPDDVAIIILDDDKSIYSFVDRLEFEIIDKLSWKVNKSYESNNKIDDTLFISNKNNVKGLEFPFVICITAKILNNYQYRNTLYTMLTRSFMQSYLLVRDDTGIGVQQQGLNIINKEQCIKTIEPTEEEKEVIKSTIIKLKDELNVSYEDFLITIFHKLKIGSDCQKKLKKMISEILENTFDVEKVTEFIEDNKKYC